MVEGRCSTLDGSTHTRTMNGRQLSCTGCADCRNLAANAVSSTDRPHACAGDPLVYSASFQHPGIAKRASLVSKATPSLMKSARLCFLLCRRDGLYFLWNNRTLETAMGNCQLVFVVFFVPSISTFIITNSSQEFSTEKDDKILECTKCTTLCDVRKCSIRTI